VRRLSRLGLDLHDAALQDLAALRAEIELLTRQLSDILEGHPHRAALLGRMDDLTARVDAMARDLRELAASLQPRAVTLAGIRTALEAEIRAAGAGGDVVATLHVDGPIDELGPGQRDVLVLFVRECIRNARRHGGAGEVSVRVFGRGSSIVAEVIDGGRGFAVGRTIEGAERAGRLGLIGMREQIRLAGGELQITSRIGGPTVVRASLPIRARAESRR
jgi:signal transduction histidine kinase